MTQANLIDIILNEDDPLPLVKRAVKSGADLEAKDEDGATPLMRAAEMDQTPVVKFLIKSGADVNAKDPDQQTALDYALEDDIGELLHRAGGEYGNSEPEEEKDHVT